MGERLDISIFCPDSSLLPSRREIVKKLFESSPEWFRSPGEVMRLDFLSGEEHNEPWKTWDNPPPFTEEPLSQTQLLFFYAASPAGSGHGRETPPCVSVEETHPPHIVYDVSLPFSLLSVSTAVWLEQCVQRAYRLFAAFGDCVLAAASEQGLPSDRSIADVLAFTLSPKAKFAWVIAPRLLALQRLMEVPDESVSEFDQAVLIQLYDPLTHLDFA